MSIGIKRLAEREPSRLKEWALSEMTDAVITALREEIRPNLVSEGGDMGSKALLAQGVFLGMTYICDKLSAIALIDGTKPQDRKPMENEEYLDKMLNKYGYDKKMKERNK